MNQTALLTVCLLGRMGDIVAAEPAFRFLHEKYPDRRFRWYTREQYVELLRFAPFIDEVVPVSGAEEYLARKAALPAGTVSYEFNFRDPRLPRDRKTKTVEPYLSLLAQFSREAGLEVPDETPVFHFNPEATVPPLPEKYAVFHCASQGRSRQWPEDCWRGLAEQFFAAGCPVVEIGMEPVLRLNHPLYVDQTGRISLQTAARIIAGANGFVGVESGFGHIANATGVFGIIITGKLRQYPDYVTYSGRFRRGEGCNLVRFYDLPAYRVPLTLVREAAARFLAGNPMSGAECDRYCLVEQIKRLRHNPGVRCAELILGPCLRLKNVIALHRRKHAAPRPLPREPRGRNF